MNDPVDDILGPGGRLDTQPGFQHRPGQHAMARVVGRVLAEGGVALTEAETGIGKTLAWLLPAALYPGRVVASTATRALQGQIIEKDAPLVSALLGQPISIAVLKGRTNYLCLHRLGQLRQTGPLDPGDRARFQAIDTWAQQTEVGDRAEVTALPEGHPLWDRLTVDADSCLGPRCPQFDPCYVTRARARAEAADIVVVNHHLYFADLAVRAAGGQVLPAHDTVIFDEAHALPEVAAPFFGCSVSSTQVDRWVRDARAATDDPTVILAVGGVAAASGDFFRAVRPSGGRAAWNPLEDGVVAQGQQYGLDDAFAFATDALTGAAATAPEGTDLASLVRRAATLRGDVDRFFTPEPGTGRVYFREARGAATHLSMQPVEPGDSLHDALFETLRACVLTSATLRTDDTFDFARARLGLPEHAETHAFASPFDYPNQARLYLPEGLPPPSHPAFPAAVAAQTEALTRLTGGRAFVLFTSHRNLRAVATLLRGRLPFPILVQGDAPRLHLLARFRERPSVLLATQSFWEGVDVVGDALSLVIIDKLPFAAPDDPVLQARAAAVKAAGGDPFRDLSIPSAALALKQGFGRLIRSPTDRGIVAICDSRLAARGYGVKILRSLPPAPIVRDPLVLATWWAAD